MFLFAESGNPTPGNKTERTVKGERSTVVTKAKEQEVDNAPEKREAQTGREPRRVRKKGQISQQRLPGTPPKSFKAFQLASFLLE